MEPRPGLSVPVLSLSLSPSLSLSLPGEGSWQLLAPSLPSPEFSCILACSKGLEQRIKRLFQGWSSRNRLEESGCTTPGGGNRLWGRLEDLGICLDGFVLSPEATTSHKKCFISPFPSSRRNREVKLLRLCYFFPCINGHQSANYHTGCCVNPRSPSLAALTFMEKHP